ncbi:MAG: 2-amino-4-hydroxy-6-hydroxymethyldihydropteridine diphosphokinase [Dehalococcoidia bacterium]|nr:2-amino-4-hydroxy-6-hydroxymethyldihydropteridine diphosphokinase [Dehalococcoidia bacterium]MEC9238050.1 2-amino-4-hydroxy-6-hydroxymethyldihydropteridine diphosphokinase [Chloroflexota bacterium]MEC9289034.1 2-amino-4-hydroxy-6-hydroxymethyldihydropteridine diphosphokinase [Chloroflexota bacterium]MEE3165878.1 2-amino-4-hydroxy-6-hydroxymethyldihydropteridine diphosphokinase [Chloroflexota bacterium]
MTSTTGYLGFGTNLGDRKKNLDRAIISLDSRPDLTILRTSGIYETEPWGMTDQPNFLNMVAEIATSISLGELLERVKKLEQDMGREDGPRFGPRLIDVDILMLEDQVVNQPDLQIPHASLHLRAFVLVPLTELAPDLVHPVLGETIAQLASRVNGLDGVKPLVKF